MFFYSNYWLIWVCWEEYSFIFFYEGIILYVFFCVFVLGIVFKLVLVVNVINILGFLGLMWVVLVYGDRVLILMVFVFGFLFICVYVCYWLDCSVCMLKEINDRLFKFSKFDFLFDLLNWCVL